MPRQPGCCGCGTLSPSICPGFCNWSVNKRGKITAAAGTGSCGSAGSGATYFCDFFAGIGDSTNPFWTLFGGCYIESPNGPGDNELCAWQGPVVVDNLIWWIGVGFDGTNYIAAINVTGGGGDVHATYLFTTTTLSDICNGGLTIPLCSNPFIPCTFPASVTLDWVP